MIKLSLDDFIDEDNLDAFNFYIENVVRSGLYENVIRFVHHYTTWNGYFGSGVASLAGKIGRSRHVFLDSNEPLEALADRSVLVASFFFDAARDEFDDRDTEHRDTHRCLAQAFLKGCMDFWQITSSPNPPEGWHGLDDKRLAEVINPPIWLEALCHRVASGYGSGTADTNDTIFRAMGYHLGFEILADREFSVIDRIIREEYPGLYNHLKNNEVEIAGQKHNCYSWVSIHSGHGGGVELDHFENAIEGARLALQFTPEENQLELYQQMRLGFAQFADDHHEFFAHF